MHTEVQIILSSCCWSDFSSYSRPSSYTKCPFQQAFKGSWHRCTYFTFQSKFYVNNFRKSQKESLWFKKRNLLKVWSTLNYRLLQHVTVYLDLIYGYPWWNCWVCGLEMKPYWFPVPLVCYTAVPLWFTGKIIIWAVYPVGAILGSSRLHRKQLRVKWLKGMAIVLELREAKVITWLFFFFY